MSNVDILKSVLSFKNDTDESFFSESLDGKCGKILWYLSAGRDFRDLLYVHSDYMELDSYPDLFIHTDFWNYYLEKRNGNILFEDEKTRISIEKEIELQFNDNFKYFIKPGIPAIRVDSPDIRFMRLKIESDELGTYNRNLLYFIVENNNFFEEIVLKRSLPISHLVTIRVGSGCGGGGHINFRYLEFFLSLIKTEYIISDEFGREIINFELIKDDRILREAFNDPANKPYILEFVKELHWSNYGIFQGDAFVAKVLSY